MSMLCCAAVGTPQPIRLSSQLGALCRAPLADQAMRPFPTALQPVALLDQLGAVPGAAGGAGGLPAGRLWLRLWLQAGECALQGSGRLIPEAAAGLNCRLLLSERPCSAPRHSGCPQTTPPSCHPPCPSCHPPCPSLPLTQFTRNAFGLSFLLILLVSLAMTAFGFFVAAFLRKVPWYNQSVPEVGVRTVLEMTQYMTFVCGQDIRQRTCVGRVCVFMWLSSAPLTLCPPCAAGVRSCALRLPAVCGRLGESASACHCRAGHCTCSTCGRAACKDLDCARTWALQPAAFPRLQQRQQKKPIL